LVRSSITETELNMPKHASWRDQKRSNSISLKKGPKCVFCYPHQPENQREYAITFKGNLFLFVSSEKWKKLFLWIDTNSLWLVNARTGGGRFENTPHLHSVVILEKKPFDTMWPFGQVENVGDKIFKVSMLPVRGASSFENSWLDRVKNKNLHYKLRYLTSLEK